MAHIGSRFMTWFDPEPTSSASSSELARGWLKSRILLVVFALLGATFLGALGGTPGRVAAIMFIILLSALSLALARRRTRRLVSARRD